MSNMLGRRSRQFSVVLVISMAFCGRAHAQIVAFGASNISGWNLAATETMPAQLQEMLRADGYIANVLNAGIYGNTTAEMRGRMDSDIPQGTTIVILDTSGGIYNNSLKGVSREQGDADMAAINARLKARGITTIPVSGANLPAQYHQQDGVHLNAEGDRLIASQLLPKIMDILGPPPGPPPTETEEMVKKACYADAKRLCASALGDDAKRHVCMQVHRSELSKDCLDAMAASRQH